MKFKFTGLSQAADEIDGDPQEIALFKDDLASEKRNRGKAMTAPTPNAGAVVAEAAVESAGESVNVTEASTGSIVVDASAVPVDASVVMADTAVVTAETIAEAGTLEETEKVDPLEPIPEVTDTIVDAAEPEPVKVEITATDALFALMAGKLVKSEAGAHISAARPVVKPTEVAKPVKPVLSALSSLQGGGVDGDESEDMADLLSMVHNQTATRTPGRDSPIKATAGVPLDKSHKFGGFEQDIGNNNGRAQSDPALAAQGKRAGNAGLGAPQGGPAQGGAGSVQGTGATTIGSMLGQVAAEAVSVPFIALSSAARHLSQRFGAGKSMSALPPVPANADSSLASRLAMPLSVANTLEEITDWKLGRIESSAKAVQKATQGLSDLEEFVVWEDKMRVSADANNVTPNEVVSKLATDPLFAELKDGMDAVWKAHPEKVCAYRDACNDFERNILNVVKEYPNSENEVQERVTAAMKNVEMKTNSMPGFGKDVGEYQRTMAERMRDIAKMIAEFMSRLLSKLTGRSSNELSL